MLGLLVLCWDRVALHLSIWYFGALVVAVAGTWVIVAVVVAVVAETWAIFTSFKLVSPVAVLVAFIGTWKCEKIEVGTTVNWDRKLLIVDAGTSFGIGTENHSKADLSFVSDFKEIVQKLEWLLHSISFAHCISLESFRKMSSLLRCESNNACSNETKRKIAINVSSIWRVFIWIKSSLKNLRVS